MDLNAYFERIGYAGPRSPSLAVLNSITAAHAETIPFENLDVLLGRPISLDPTAIFEKLVTSRRGGYCFEQNALLGRALSELGFDVAYLSGRVRVGRARSVIPPRTHLFLRVELDQSYLTDVGVGALSLTQALALDERGEQRTPHEPRRIVADGVVYFHQALLAEGWSDVCEFTLERMPAIDQEIANWYTSAHPNSQFRNRLLVARALGGGGRAVLLNDQLKLRNASGAATVTMITDPMHLLALLREHFGLVFAPETRFREAGLPWPA
jgi:N-hydroxyarylamine O-acetyltransferase